MDKNRIQQFFDSLESERKELREDLIGLPLSTSSYTIGDFGCGSGNTTWCLLLELPYSNCVGIDKFEQLNIPRELLDNFERQDIEDRFQCWSIDSVEGQSREIIDYINSSDVELQEHNLSIYIRHVIVDEERYPVFRKANLLTGEGLSSDLDHYFDLIYCKRLLHNIFVGDNINPDRDEGLNLVINHITNSLKPNGWLCIIEIAALRDSSNLEEYLKQCGFRFDSPRQVNRPYKTIERHYDKYPYLIYQCQKTK